jgi:chemotaxis response regulator CheB
MQPLSVVLLQPDSARARELIEDLAKSFPMVYVTGSEKLLRTRIAQHHPTVVILDLEMFSTSSVEHLSRDFPGMPILCTHRLADDAMWTAALGAGATDIYPADDVSGIVKSAVRGLTDREHENARGRNPVGTHANAVS